MIFYKVRRVTHLNVHLINGCTSSLIDKVLQVLVHELKYEVKLIGLTDHILETNDIGMFKLLQDTDLPDGGGGDTLVFALQSDLFDGYNLNEEVSDLLKTEKI